MLNMFVSDGFIGLYCTGIALIFLASVMMCARQRNLIVNGMQFGVLELDRGFGGGTQSRTEHFAKTIDMVSKTIGVHPLLGGKWSEYRQSLFIPEGDPETVYGSLSAESFFGEDGFMLHHFNERLFSAVPNWLTGIGILGTFIGLVVGIQLADIQALTDSGGRLDTIELVNGATASLSKLLDASKLAFLTSLAGLSLSIAFSVLEKYFFRKAAASVASFTAVLDASVVRYSPEVISKMNLDLLKGLVDGPEGATPAISVRTELGRSVEPFIDGFRESVEGILARSAAAAIKPDLDKISSHLEEIKAERALETSSTVRGMMEAFFKSMEGTPQATIESLKEVNLLIKENIAAGKEMVSSVKAASKEMGTVVKSLSKVASTAQKAADDAGKHFAESTLGLRSAVEGLGKGIADSLDKAAGDVSSAAAARISQEVEKIGNTIAGDVTKSIGKLGDAALGAQNGLTAAVQESAAAQLSVLKESMDGAAESLKDFLKESRSNGEELQLAVLAKIDGCQKIFDNVSQLTESMVSQMGVTSETCTAAARKAAESVNAETLKFIAGQNAMLAEANRRTENVWLCQEAGAKVMKTSVEKMLTRFDGHVYYLDDSYERNIDAGDRMLRGLQTLWDSQEARQRSLDVALTTALGSLQTSYLQNIRQAEDHLQRIDDSFATAISSLRITVQEMGHVLHYMPQ
ncbi:MAG: hypothetical protein LBT40_04890 [Deltaproteobacteria bacterium]|jgi:hypothetical protein|nr:hypothetical protein [Deltaproteobacteria bacterium]